MAKIVWVNKMCFWLAIVEKALEILVATNSNSYIEICLVIAKFLFLIMTLGELNPRGLTV